MAASMRVSLDSRFRLVKMGYRNGVVIWVYLSSLLVTLFRFVYKIFWRYEEDESGRSNFVTHPDDVNSTGDSFTNQEDNPIETVTMETEEAEPIIMDSSESMFSESDEKEPGQPFLLFKFPSFAEFTRISKDIRDSDIISEENFAEQEEVSSFPVKELDTDSGDFCSGSTDDSEKEIPQALVEENLTNEEKPVETKILDEEELEEKPELDEEGRKSDLYTEKDNFPNKFHLISEKDWLESDSDSDSMTSSHDFSVMSRLLDSNSEGGFFSDGDDEEVFKENREEVFKENPEEVPKENKTTAEEFDEDTETEEELWKSKDSEKENGSEYEDSQLDDLWEHQDLIEQLKMELKRVKATGLPTIDENSESPKVMDDLKPWKIDEKFHRGACISELHKVYKSYRERMRKFDILNYQKMYALGYLRTKDPLDSIPSGSKSSSPCFTSILLQSLGVCKQKKSEPDDPVTRFAGELHGDLETVYVGQLCLSWEFLHWQYEKALDLWESDQYLVRRYNEVAGEFQQLQVVMQRFLENEEFEGPRVQYYVKSRCFLRNLLQIPVIREDNSKAKKKMGLEMKGEFAVTSDVLVEIVEESIRIFWRFIRADKDARSSVPKGRKGGHRELQNPADLELFTEIQTALQKKEKKLKELLKGGNCILRKLQKHEEDGSSSTDQVLAFFSQVDMKLVRRVLNMSRLSTDHLTWCSSKLNRISFMQRRIRVEPSFLLFPC